MIKIKSVLYLMTIGAGGFYFLSDKINFAALDFDDMMKFLDPFWLAELFTDKLFTEKELSQYNGVVKEELYLSVLGKVYDVSKGRQYYGPGQSYHGFVGKDASKAFITGDFKPGLFSSGLSDDVLTLPSSELGGLLHWVELYQKNYIYKGKLVGRFYTADGSQTPYLLTVLERIKEVEDIEATMKMLDHRFPACNLEWSAEHGKIVWCSQKSGGIVREWVGVPRKFFLSGHNHYRCACVQPNTDTENEYGHFKMYGECEPDAEKCYLRFDEED